MNNEVDPEEPELPVSTVQDELHPRTYVGSGPMINDGTVTYQTRDWVMNAAPDTEFPSPYPPEMRGEAHKFIPPPTTYLVTVVPTVGGVPTTTTIPVTVTVTTNPAGRGPRFAPDSPGHAGLRSPSGTRQKVLNRVAQSSCEASREPGDPSRRPVVPVAIRTDSLYQRTFTSRRSRCKKKPFW